MTTLRVELTYPIKEWGHILQNIKQENEHCIIKKMHYHTCLTRFA